MIPISNKYKILAINLKNLAIHTQNDSFLFLAKDMALPGTISHYIEECEAIGVEQSHLDIMRIILNNVNTYQSEIESKIPDTNLDNDDACEVSEYTDQDISSISEFMDNIGNRLLVVQQLILNALPDTMVTIVPDSATGNTKKHSDLLEQLTPMINDLFTISKLITSND